MSFNDMAQSLILDIPGIPAAKARTLINDALGYIYDSQYWSWQVKQSGWLTPGLLFPLGPGNSGGTVTTTSFQTTVIGDATASAAWEAYLASSNRPLFTELQFRSPSGSLYNIIGVASNTGGIGYNEGGYNQGGYPIDDHGENLTVLTLDRPWMEVGGADQSYMIYQCYFAVPVPDFKRFLHVQDTTNNFRMDYWSLTQKDLALQDPERTTFNNPAYVVPYEQDQRTGSATYGNMLYELWPHPLSVLPYNFSYLRRGPTLVAPGDTVPYPLTEEPALWRAKELGFLWKEAQKGEQVERGSGADYKFLSRAALEEYKIAIKPIKDRDRDLFELYWNRYVRENAYYGEPYMNMVGGLNVGRM